MTAREAIRNMLRSLSAGRQREFRGPGIVLMPTHTGKEPEPGDFPDGLSPRPLRKQPHEDWTGPKPPELYDQETDH